MHKQEYVLQIANYSAHYRGNFIESLSCLEENLKNSDIKTIYAFYPENYNKPENWMKKMEEDGHSVVYLTGSIGKDIKLLRNITRNNKIKIIHTHFISMKQYLSLRFLTILKRYPIVMHFHNHSKEAYGVKKIIRRFLYAPCYMIACSESVFKSVERDYPDNLKCNIDNGVYFQRVESLQGATRAEYNVHSDSTLCLIFGFDYYRKGVDLALKAIKNLNELKAANIELLISLSTNFEEVEKNIRSDIGHIPEWVHIIHARNDVARLYNLTDVFLSPSREEGLPYSVLEAAYCSCNVIMSDISAQKNLKIPYGIWHRSEDVESLKNAINKAIRQKQIKKENMIDIRRQMEKTYSLQEWEKCIEKVYKQNGM